MRGRYFVMNEEMTYWMSQLEISECSAPLFALVIARLMEAIWSLQEFDQINFHTLVDVPIAGECLAALFMARQRADKIGVLDLFV